MKCVVTRAAGFIGSHLVEQLLRDGHQVVGLDAFVPYYPRVIKERNLLQARRHPAFRFAEVDLRCDSLDAHVAGADVVFHLAAMAGLMWSWVQSDLYVSCNVQATERLLQALRRAAPGLRRLIYASTSSVYGRYASGDEAMPTRPISPYGVTKLAAEHLGRAFLDAFELPWVVLRYFSVYGPRQRPDMGYHKFMRALLTDEPIEICGDGHQIRGNTYIDDCIAATIAAAEAPIGEIYNVGGGETASVWDIVRQLENLAGRKARIEHVAKRPGDQQATSADTVKLHRHLGWKPRTCLQDGLAAQWCWQQEIAALSANAKVA
jgi:nucleoside-diphosphate-sugar epimerase